MDKIIRKFTYTIAALLAVMVFIFSSYVGGGLGVAHAATSTTVTSFDNTYVLDDLETATIDGKKFNIVNYPYDSTGIFKHPEIFSFVEYCYSMRSAQRNDYGLYVYFYNPQALNISTSSKSNKITLGVKYGTDEDGNIKVEDYEKFDLLFCSKSTGDYNDLFYKFKVIDHKSDVDGKLIVERVNSNARRYDISEVELLTVGDVNATAYGVGGTYTFTGYAKGYGSDTTAESTLAGTRQDLETIKLDLAGVTDGVDKRTFWRSNSSSKGAHYQNQINSVFFAIDTNVLERYGYTLQKIKAEWWEYKTVPSIEIGDTQIYNILQEYCGVKIENKNENYWVSNSAYPYTLAALASTIDGSASGYYQYNYNYVWNCGLGAFKSGLFSTVYCSTKYNDVLLPLLFDTYGLSADDYVLTAERLQEYFENYNKSYERGHLIINEHDYSADLFLDEVDEGRTRGYNLREFDITNPDDYWQINSYDSTHNWLQKFIDYGFGAITTNDDYSNISPIQMLRSEDFTVSNVADHLMINENDVDKLKDYYNDSVKDKNGDGKPDNTVFLFRYAQTDYYSQDLSISDAYGKIISSDAEVRQGTQFFDFDILTMTFNKSGALTVLGVVSSPVDHWSDYTSPIEPTYIDWKKIFAIVLGLLVLIFLFVIGMPVIGPFLVTIFYGVLWVVCLPFKLIAKLFKKKE